MTSVIDTKAIDQWIALFANRDEMAWEYARWIIEELADEGADDWRQLNEAIIRCWSESGLLYIKRKAWAYVRDQEAA